MRLPSYLRIRSRGLRNRDGILSLSVPFSLHVCIQVLFVILNLFLDATVAPCEEHAIDQFMAISSPFHVVL